MPLTFPFPLKDGFHQLLGIRVTDWGPGRASLELPLRAELDNLAAVTPGGVAINTKHVKTEVLVENGGTVVIGGIYYQRDRTDNTRVPFFGDLPYIGFLFRNQVNTSSKTELLVFITPRIVTERMTVR